MAKGHAVAVLIVSPEGIPLIRDPKKPSPIYWKLPGGRGDASEGEQIGIFSPTDIISLQDFFPNHRKVVEQVLRTL